ncbi:MAG: DNA mismatch repair endonuclease MutL [Firmicutes bacterium]|nr:DNA mismatch repair endonuclease MutL [Bacillota bacterium]
MSKIKLMSESLANKISAGEVVERVSSVVKELVENSIDAQSTDIRVSLVNSGLNGIIVQDNGVGMDSEDAILCFSSHATSKLVREDDLFFINTLGFRGEALPSIASVSEVDLTTSTGDAGTHIKIKGGEVLINESTQALKGTKIEVKNLFYNTPARLKFLKSEQTELSNVVSLVERLSLANPSIRFTLENNDNVIVKTSGSGDLKKTIHEIFGLQVSSKLIEINASNDDYDISGYICKPEILKSNRNYMITFVNNRLVKNMDLNRAINDAYYTYKPDIKYPIVVLNIYTDPTLVDVNIHPTKQDIKLSKISELNELINKTIKDALYNNLLIPDATLRVSSNFKVDDLVLNDILKENNIEEEKIDTVHLTDDHAIVNQTTFDFGAVEEESNTYQDNVVVNTEMKNLVLYPIGQAHGTYILAENDEGFYLIDQHAAQERVNYEKIQKIFREKKISTVESLIPITIELSKSDAIIIKNNLEYLKSMGFVLEEFGINTFVVKEEPTWLTKGFEEETIREVIDQIILKGNSFDPLKYNDHICKTIACKMSIKANTKMTLEAMRELLNELVLCDNPYNCCHGRPSIIKFSIYDLERMFKRSMN